jgi:MerR family transcriptional regulator, light-induced transcriptional regulator
LGPDTPISGALTLAAAPAMLRAPVSLDEHRRALLDALLARDSARARRAIDAALAAGAPILDVYLDVLRPVLAEIGHRWATGELNVAEEHYGTATAQALLDALSARLPRPPGDGRLAVVTGTPGEQHALGARMVADFLEADGWEVLLLGPGAPAHDLAELVDLERPDVVALSTATAGALPGVVEVLGALGELRPRPFIVVGGQFWTAETSAVAAELGADAVIHDPRELVAILRERVPPAAPEP